MTRGSCGSARLTRGQAQDARVLANGRARIPFAAPAVARFRILWMPSLLDAARVRSDAALALRRGFHRSRRSALGASRTSATGRRARKAGLELRVGVEGRPSPRGLRRARQLVSGRRAMPRAKAACPLPALARLRGPPTAPGVPARLDGDRTTSALVSASACRSSRRRARARRRAHARDLAMHGSPSCGGYSRAHTTSGHTARARDRDAFLAAQPVRCPT